MDQSNEAKSRAYQLAELEIARNPNHPAHLLPPVSVTDRSILDLGCGAAQTLIAADFGRDRLVVGIDVDLDALKLGKSLKPDLLLVCGRGEALPFRDEAFALVTSRVAFPYMQLSSAVREVSRVLLPGGGLWCSLHPLRLTLGELVDHVARREWRGAVYRIAVLCSGTLLHFTGKQLPARWLRGRNESFQSRRGIRRMLLEFGFARDTISVERDRFFIAQARKPAYPGPTPSPA